MGNLLGNHDDADRNDDHENKDGNGDDDDADGNDDDDLRQKRHFPQPFLAQRTLR